MAVVDQFVKFIEKSDAKDKVFKLIAFGAKVVLHYEETGGAPRKQWITNLKTISESAGDARIWGRLAKSVGELKKLAEAKWTADPKDVLTIVRSFCNAVYFLLDHYTFLGKKKILTIEQELWNDRQRKVLIAATVCIMLLDWINFSKEVSKAKKTVDTDADISNKQAAAKTISAKRHEFVLNFIKNFADLQVQVIALNRLNVSAGYVGWAGVISAAIACYQIWVKG
eukprot:TRINITY_DN15315_c0_g1_i1.p1 TRINITY_DN15315_c0_g1~~TRINITY_DN15315_c0_g1_i1.p1  ORF type:complete len:226 (-),score=62.26 TRINITY_DN15315_c0_g1_i1:17-694(-)